MKPMKVEDLSTGLIARAVAAEGWDFDETQSGIVIDFDFGILLLSIRDDIVVATAALGKAGNKEEIADVLDEWHRRQPWPKAWQEEDGTVVAEVAGFFPIGMTLAQMSTQVRCAVGAMNVLAQRLQHTY